MSRFRKGYQPITPTYTATLNTAIVDVIRALNSQDFDTAWVCLKTLIDISPPPVEDESMLMLDAIEKEITSVNNPNRYQQQLIKIRIRHQNTRPLLRLVKRLLYNEGYLEKPWGDRITKEHFAELESEGIEG